MSRSPERRAWAVLLVSLFACCALAVGVPTGAIAFINTASNTPRAHIQLQAGIVSTFDAGEVESVDARVVDLNGRVVGEGSTIVVGGDLDSVAALSLDPPVDGARVTMQLYSGTRLRIQRLSVPRYSISSASDEYVMSVERGRIEVQAQYPAGRKLRLRLNTPQAQLSIGTSGAFGLEIGADATHVLVYEGEIAAIPITNTQIMRPVRAGEHALVRAGVVEPLLAARNVIRNSGFDQALQPGNWVVSATASVGAPLGQVGILVDGSTSRLDLNRTGAGIGPGRTSVTQPLDQSAVSRQSVRVRVTFEILEQEIQVCGSTGSECPMMIEIAYARKDGSAASWRQGFYAVGVPAGGSLPDYVVREKQSKHIYKNLQIPAHFTSDNLLSIAPEMALIKSITIFAEGHSVHVQVRRVELWVQD
jgi:hypothetical protein